MSRVGAGRGVAGNACPGADLRSRSVMAKAVAESLGARLDDRPVRGRQGPRLDHSSAANRRRQLQGRDVQSPPIGTCCTPAPPVLEFDQAGNLVGALGRPRPGLRVAGVEPRHHGRSQGQRLDRRQRRQGHHVLKFTREGKFLLQIGKQGTAQRQQRHGSLLAGREDLRRPGGQRGLHR